MSPRHSAVGMHLYNHCVQLTFWAGASSSPVTIPLTPFHAECSCHTNCLEKVDENSGAAQMQRLEIQGGKEIHCFTFSLSLKRKSEPIGLKPNKINSPATSFHSKHFSWIVRVISFLCSHPKRLLVKYDFAIITTCITGGVSHRLWPSYNANVSKTVEINVRFWLLGLSLPSLEIEIDNQSIIVCFRASSGHLWGPGFTFFSLFLILLLYLLIYLLLHTVIFS